MCAGSKDPNSLSNLDQDLPNYLQSGGVRIHSLPEEWLWCEAWCGNRSLAAAQTIDLPAFTRMMEVCRRVAAAIGRVIP